MVIRPPQAATYTPEENAIIGNCALYGATGGKLFVHGLAGDRFAVRNSGAIAVVEGTGLHACEYMTNGSVLILGPVSHNVGAGMTGGALFLSSDYDRFVNKSYIDSIELQSADEEFLRATLEEYFVATESVPARMLLEDFTEVRKRIRKYLPVADVLRMQTESQIERAA